MADGKQPRLVKKLFFPAYAAAGSNDNFQPPHDDGGASESDATTAILDNRRASRPQQHEVQYDGDKVGGYAPAADTIDERKRFFPSTDSPHSPLPAKPPQQRPSMTARSVSTTTRSGIRPFPTTSPRVQLRIATDADSSLDQSSVTASSAAFSSVVGVVFLNESNQVQSKEDAQDKDPTPVKDNRSGDSSVFKPRLANFSDNSSEVVSDINSNASEMGTVIELGASGRLADVEAMAALIERSDPASLYEAESAASDVERAPAKDVPGLSLPTLEERRSDERPIQSKPQNKKSSVFRERMDSVFRDRHESPPPPADENPSSASALVTAAIQHIGSGVGYLGQNTSPSNFAGPHSAPATPRVVPPSPRVKDYLRSSLPFRSNDQPTSVAHLLRSPGSAAHFQTDDSCRQHKSALAPRVSHRFDRGSTRADRHADSRSTSRHANSLSSPLRFARGCLSFDSTLDDSQPTGDTSSIPESQPQFPSLRYQKRRDPSPNLSPHPVVQSHSWDLSSGTSSMHAQTPRTPLDNAYRSFSFGKSPSERLIAKPRASAFRPAPLSRVRNANEFSFQSIPGDTFSGKTLNNISPAVANANAQNTLTLRTPQRIEIEREDALDILACLVERSVAFDNELALSSRVETIQEADENAYQEDGGESNVDSVNMVSSSASEKLELTDDRVSTFADIGVRTVEARDVLQSPPKNRRTPAIDLLQADCFSPDLTDAIRLIRKISQDYERNMADGHILDDEGMGHSVRMNAIDELLRSHTYAVEMRQAAKSASTWLRSIDRSDGTAAEKGRQPGESKDGDNSSVPNSAHEVSTEIHVSQTKEEKNPNHSVGDEHKSERFMSRGEMDNAALKAMLHSAELKSKEREDLALRLNAELSECRAEIGRLKTASRAEIIFASPHRSILDDDAESTSSAAASTTHNAGFNMIDDIIENASPIPRAYTERDTSIEASFVRSDVILQKTVEKEGEEWLAVAEAKSEAVLLKAALSQANETIRRLHEEMIRLGSDDGDTDAPVVSFDNPELSKELDDYKEAIGKAMASREVVSDTIQAAKGTSNSPGISDRRTINVQMLDGENFVTEWGDLAPPLPPPPDHGLRSPIVAALLQQWTSDALMHDALLSWLERILNGANPETVPPLTISSLDHQIRDGFTMHVLPLLLRRPDIHVDVKTRAHRRTSYDLSVAVTRPVLLEHGSIHFERNESSQPRAPSTEKAKKTHMMAFQASHGNHAVLEESMLADVGAPTQTQHKVSDYLYASSFAHSSDVGTDSVAHSTATALVTNSSRRSRMNGHQRREAPTGSASPARIDDRDLAKMTGPLSRAMLGDDISTSSSTTGGSSQKSAEQPGLIRSLGGAFGGLLRRKPIEPSPFQGEPFYDENGYAMQQHDAVPSFLRHAPPPNSPSRAEEDGQPYHRVVSAPPGRIGVTFVEYRGHAMVSDVAPESPLSGWVFPSDILIAIDEVPVSGMRVREIVKLLTSRKSAQRALRVISSHAMNEFTLNTSTPSEAGALS